MNSARSLVAVLLLVAGPANAQTWAPQKPVEIVVPNTPGGTNDKLARSIEAVLVNGKLLTPAVAIVNKPGGGGQIARTYVNQRGADPHVLLIGTPSLLMSHIIDGSRLDVEDFTPVALIFNDYIAFAVNAGSPIATGRDLVARMRSDARSVSVGLPGALGSTHQHIVTALFMKSIGTSPRNMKAVAFRGSGEGITALLGGHVDLVTTGAGNASPHAAAGKLRVVAVSSPQRLHGSLASTPTWKEQGVDLTYGSWRAVFAPKGVSPQQVRYWEGALRKVTESPQWKSELEKNYWSDFYIVGPALRTTLDKEYAEMKAVMVELGFAK